MIVLGGKVFGRYVDDVSGALINVVGVFIKKAPARSFAPPTTWGHDKKASAMIEREASPECDHAGNLNLDF